MKFGFKNYLYIALAAQLLVGGLASCNSSTAKDKVSSVPQPEFVLTDMTSGVVNGVYTYNPEKSTPQLWQYQSGVAKAHTNKIISLPNGNVLFLGEQGNEDYNFQPLLLLFDNSGKDIASLRIPLSKDTKYELSYSSVIPEKDGGFTLYIMKDIPKNATAVYDDSDVVKMRSYLEALQLEKLVFEANSLDYQVESIPLNDLLFEEFHKRELVGTRNITLRSSGNQLFLTGTVNKPNSFENLPFVIALDNNLNIERMAVLEEYADTHINHIEKDTDGKLYIEGNESTAMDGWYYDRNMRFELDKKLNVIADYSDAEPYSSFYRGPSAPDYTDDSDEYETEDTEETVEEAEVEDDMPYKHTILTSRGTNSTYLIKSGDFNPSKAIFEKKDAVNGTLLWQTELWFPDNYILPYLNSSEGFETPEGGFAFFMHLRDEKAAINLKSNILILVFDKEGRIIQQIQTPVHNAASEFLMEKSGNQLIAYYISTTAGNIDDEWVFGHSNRIQSYFLKSE